MSEDSEGAEGPEQERVRRLLADLALTDEVAPPPVPPDVAARLDAALAEVAARPAEVVPLRRRFTPALVAAAAVVAVAGGATAVITSQQDGSLSSAGGAGGAESADEDRNGGDGTASGSEPLSSSPPDSRDDTGPRTATSSPVLSGADLRADAARLVAAGQLAIPESAAAALAEARQAAQDAGCVVPPPERGAATLATLDGRTVVVLVGAGDAGRRPVEALDCLTGAETAATTIAGEGASPGG